MKSKTLFPIFFVGLCCTLALLLRLWGLRAESAWWDEYASLTFLDAPTLAAFLQQNRTLDPATLPLYFVIEYLWAHTVSTSLVSLRLLSIAIGIGTIPLIYALGARLFGRHAGYMAALLLTLSPIHIHHSQGIRMYGLLILLGTASVWSLVRMIQQGKRSGWWLHGLCSMLLYWTHPFALLIPAAQGCWLLLHRRLYRAMLPGWFLMQAMLTLPVLGYILSIKFWPQETTQGWLNRPGIGTLFADLFFDDIVAFHWQLRLGDVGIKLGSLRFIGDAIFAAIIIACLVYWSGMVVRRKPESRKTHLTLLLCWLIVPPLTLFLISQFWRPCMFPRYTAPSAIALYVLLGGLVQQLRLQEWRMLAYGTLTTLMLFQWGLTQPGPQRTNWQDAATQIAAHAQPQDIILVEDLLWRDVFLYNATRVAGVDLRAPVAAAANSSLLAAQSALFLGLTRTPREEPGSGDVWAVIASDYFDTSPPSDYEQLLQMRNMAFRRSKHQGIRDVYVYHIQFNPVLQLPYTLADFYERQEETSASPFHGYIKHDAMKAFADLAVALANQGRNEAAIGLMDDLFQTSPFAKKVYGNLTKAILAEQDTRAISQSIEELWKGYGYRENERVELARQSFAKALELDPDNGIAALELGIELVSMRRYEEAAEVLERAAALDTEDAELVDNLIVALHKEENIVQMFRAVLTCRDALLALSDGELTTAERLFRQALAKDPNLPRAQVMLGFVCALQERYDKAYTLFVAYLAHGKYQSSIAYIHLALIHLLRDEPQQALAHAQKAMALDPEFKQRTEGLIHALLVEKDYEVATQEIARLKKNGVHIPRLFADYLQKKTDSNQE